MACPYPEGDQFHPRPGQRPDERSWNLAASGSRARRGPGPVRVPPPGQRGTDDPWRRRGRPRVHGAVRGLEVRLQRRLGDEKLEASLRRIEERLGTLPDSAPQDRADVWKVPDTPLDLQDCAPRQVS